MPQMMRAVIVDDHLTFSELLAHALSGEPDVVCVGTATEATSGACLVEDLLPDVVIMDVQLGDEDGIALTARLTERFPDLRVLVLTARTDGTLVQRAAAAGACALLPKNGSLSEVLTALRGAQRGGLAVHPHLLKTLVTVPEQRKVIPSLTERERDVLSLLGQGASLAEIATSLSISEHTARGHIKKVLMKLGAHTQLEAVALAHRHGLLP